MSGCTARGAKGWPPERRARQAERIRLWRPWCESTGPKTDIGKARGERACLFLEILLQSHRDQAAVQALGDVTSTLKTASLGNLVLVG